VKRREFITVLGGAAAWPVAASAQVKMPVVGFLGSGSPGPLSDALSAFYEGLKQVGYVNGQNVALEYRWADGHYDRLPGLAAELVGRNVAVIVASATSAAQAAKSATTSIPIVFNMGTDPVKDGLATSLNRPGGNATGVSNITTGLASKRLRILSDLVPAATTIAFLINPKTPIGTEMEEAEAAARAARRLLLVLEANSEPDIETSFHTIIERGAGALLVASDPFFYSARDQLVALAAHHKLPAIYQFRAFAIGGGLMSYGTSQTEAYRQIGVYAGRILKGAKPSELPVVLPVKFELILNLKTAKTLGLTFPPELLAIADEVIE
jgi:putative ABC transport system substrate-binding protein